MAGRPQETSAGRKEFLETPRRTEPSTSQTAMGQSGKGICVRRADGQDDARGFVLRQEPAHYLSFHVRAGLAARVRTLLLLADHFDSVNIHLGQRDTALAVVSRAPWTEIEPFKKRMGWKFR